MLDSLVSVSSVLQYVKSINDRFLNYLSRNFELECKLFNLCPFTNKELIIFPEKEEEKKKKDF